jgi:hypothetical protein
MTTLPLDRVVGVQVDGASDSRRCMKEIAKLLGLDAEATEEQIVEALEARPDFTKVLEPLELDLKDDASEEEIVAAVKAKLAEKSEEPKGKELSLEDRAKKEGKVVLSAEDVATLHADSKAGRKASEELHQGKFDTAYNKAVDEVRLKTSDETREKYQALYNKAPEETIEILDELPKLANTEARGAGGKGGEPPKGVHEERYELNKRVEARMADKSEDYPTALQAVMAEDARSED